MSGEQFELYEGLSEPQRFGYVERKKGVLKEVGTQVYLHEVLISPEVLSAEDLFTTISSFTQVRDPRVPAIIDAWQNKESINYVTLELEGFPLDSSEARSILKSIHSNYFEEMAFQTLATIAALHSQNATHRRIRKEVFNVHDTGFVFMCDGGLIERINKIIEEQTVGNGGQLMLVSNLAAYDVVDWAAMVATLMTDTSILDPSTRISDEILPEDVAQAQKKILQLNGETPMSLFLNKCLQARADNVAVYDNGGEALRAFPERDKS